MKVQFGRAAALALSISVYAAATVGASAAGDPHAAIIGVWQTEDQSQVTVSVCPDDYCGVLTHVAMAPASYAKLSAADKKAVDAQDPKQFPDTKNKDAKLRSRSLVGLKMFTLHPSNKPDIFNGTLYNPQDGGTYDGYIRVESPKQLLLSGCVFKVLCKSQEWNRVK